MVVIIWAKNPEDSFKHVSVQGEAGEGAVRVTINGSGDLLRVELDPVILRSINKEAVGRLILSAVNAANAEKDAMIARETKAMMAGLGLTDKSS